jgi:hypothetical protein
MAVSDREENFLSCGLPRPDFKPLRHRRVEAVRNIVE